MLDLQTMKKVVASQIGSKLSICDVLFRMGGERGEEQESVPTKVCVKTSINKQIFFPSISPLCMHLTKAASNWNVLRFQSAVIFR